MTAVMWTYSQVVWAYFILDAATLATSKFVEMPPKSSDYLIKKEDLTTELPNFNTKITNNTSKDITAKADSLQPMGLFAAHPSNIQDLLQDNTKHQAYPNTQPRYAENFGTAASSSEQRYRGTNPQRLALFSKLNKKKTRSGKHSHKLPEPKGSDRYLTPELYKFKTDIEKETVRTHIRGLKMSPDASAAPTIIRDSRYPPKYEGRYNYRRPSNLVREETFSSPYVYDEPYSYDESPPPSAPYAKPVSYQQYSSIPREPYYPTSTGSSYYEPPSDYSFPHYPTVEPEPYYYPKPAEPDTYNKYSSSDSGYDFPVEYPPSPPLPPINFHSSHNYFPNSKNREIGGENDEPEDGSPANDEDDIDPKDFPSSEPAPKGPKKSHRNPNYEVSEYGSDPSETDVNYSPKKSRNRKKARKPKKKPETPKEDEDEEFDSNYEPPDTFQDDKDENVEADDSTEDEPPAPKARLRSSSKKQVKRIRSRPNPRNKRCVKKRKEMSVETEMASGGFDEEPSQKMTCLVCENLDTGGTYETCSYESDPKKNNYYAGNEASYRKGNGKAPYKYHRMRRETVTIINSTSTPLKRIVRRTHHTDSMGSFTSDVEDFGSDDFTDDDNEDQQEDEDDDMEEYKPSLPAYANEDACTEISKNGLTCMVCINPETNGKYKQCSYADDPDKNNYEYAQSSSYGKKDVPYKSRQRRQPKKQAANAKDAMQTQNTVSKEVKVPTDWKLLRTIEQKKIGAINDNFKKLIHSKEQPDSDTLASIANPSYEEQFLTLFPELGSDNSGESLMGEHSLLKELNEKPAFSSKDTGLTGFSGKDKIGGYFKKKKSLLDHDDDDEDTEMSKMMKEFKTKDRSACKKTKKDKMTCYTCDDKDGIKREECMYVVENEPTKVSYHESKQTKPEENHARSSNRHEVYYKSPAKTFKYKYIPSFELKDQPALGSMIHKTISDKTQRKYGLPDKPKGYSNVKIHTEKTYSLKTLPTVTKIGKRDVPKAQPQEQQAQGSSKKQVYHKSKTKPEEESEAEFQVEPEHESEDPEENGTYAAAEVIPEVDPESPDGLFSDDTKDVYSPEMKVTLPRFMAEKSEHEKLLDEFLDKM
ncbi:uncharacterized protein LOC135849951 [Planococcus citri]|uniref:uncharacterized protein LOC135849951 n=1 Tax=Planococcus citri TaxID=170843 RepID=UPI0031F8419C